VLLSISFVDAEWIESKPTGKGNKAVCSKYLNKYSPTTYIGPGSTTGSKSAAGMLAEH